MLIKKSLGDFTMLFVGIAREFSLLNEDQYNTIGDFYDEMAEKYGLENLVGLGYKWTENKIFYAIGLRNGDIDGSNLCIELPDEDWVVVSGKTECLKEIYDEIYKDGPIKYEIEAFTSSGECEIKYRR